ncbi:hypothetical protein [Streptomyces sp. NTH33]|uniref:hypothetical protein n=1 Tax=Streptomyces sp. NTH33 TaxID=1735453 RepID=UPI0011B94AA0|nr:hypothetical protein [Streptomyces sp. NTH33]
MPAHQYRVVGVEFGKETPLRSFATLLPPPWRDGYHRIDLLTHPDIRRTVRTVEEQAEYWARRLGPEPGPAVVLGYCSGAGVASELAARMGADTTLVLVDPAAPTAGEAQELLAELATGMDEDLLPGDVPDILGHGPAEALAVISDFLRSVVERCAPDLPSDIADSLTEHQRAWLSYTLAAGTHGGVLRDGPDHVLLSEAAAWEHTGSARVHRFPVGEVELFTSEEAMAVIAGVLDGRTATTRSGV